MSLISYTASAISRLFAGVCALACVWTQAAEPAFSLQPLNPTSRAQVIEVKPSQNVDVVYTKGGLDQGFRTGMACEIIRDGATVARLVLVEVSPEYSAALILDIQPETGGIRQGDTVTIQTFNLSK